MADVVGPSRDFIGYGRDVPKVIWPGGAKVAVSLVVNYEEGSERSFFAGDGSNEGLGELNRVIDPQIRDLATESVYEYGSRAGIHRLMRIFRAHGVKCTFFAAAMALEKNPEVVDWIREDGHEPCSHGLRWAEDWKLSREEQQEQIRLAVVSIMTTCGERPVGWYCRWMPSIYTRELLVEEGGFLYDSDAYNDDLPYYVKVGGKSHLVVPYSLTYNDVRFVSGGFGGPSDFFDYCRRAIDFLIKEGEDTPKMISIGVHSRWTGQAGRASALDEFIHYALNTNKVWFATRREIASTWIEQFPSQ